MQDLPWDPEARQPLVALPQTTPLHCPADYKFTTSDAEESISQQG